MKFQVFILWSFVIFNSFGQVSIKGRVKDQHENLPFATILLLSQDSSLVKGAITNENGEFSIENIVMGRYRVSSSMVGYTKQTSHLITIEEKDIVLPDILLEEEATELNEVVVKVERPLYEQRADRLVMNVQSSITTSGNTILELLQKSPGVAVNRQNNTVTMNGKSGVRVMINDKIVQLPLDVVIQMLDGMNSTNVDRIELITTPPSKYDAEGNAGIIHIVMKENTDYGTNGSYGFTLGAHWAETLGSHFTINHRNQKLSYLLDYSVLRDHNLHILSSRRESIGNEFQFVDDESHRENITSQHNLSAGVEWKPGKNTILNFLFTGNRRNWNLTALTNDINQLIEGPKISTDMNIRESNIWQSTNGSIALLKKIGSKTNFNLNVDYLYYHNNNPSSYDNKIKFDQSNITEIQKIDLQKTTPIQIIVAKMDYEYSVSPTFKIETGIKGVTSLLTNNVLVQRLVNDTWNIDPVFSSYSTLNEQLGASYFSTKWQPLKKWQINGGIRYEYTHTAISSATQKNIINRKYGYFFPSFFLQKDMDKERSLHFSYSRRITRPTYNDIAPYVFFWGPNTFSAGNTSLYPAVADAVKVGYNFKQWIVSFQATHSAHEIVNLQPEVDTQSNSLTYRSQNLKYLKTTGLSTSYSFALTPWWEIQNNFTAQYQVGETSHLTTNVKLYLYGLNFNIINNLKLPKDFAIEISGIYQSKTLLGVSVFLPQGSFNAGIQKKFGNKGTIKLSMDDILYTNFWRIRTNQHQNNLSTYFNYNWHAQFIRINYTKNFGNKKLNSVKLKSGSEEERRRVN